MPKPIDLAPLRALHKRVKAGLPLSAHPRNDSVRYLSFADGDQCATVQGNYGVGILPQHMAAYVEIAANALPALVSEVARLRRALAKKGGGE